MSQEKLATQKFLIADLVVSSRDSGQINKKKIGGMRQW